MKGLTTLPEIGNLIDANPLVAALFVFIFLDIASGLFAGGKDGKLSSTISFAGMMKKCQITIICAGCFMFQWVIFKISAQNWPLAGAATTFFIVTEFISILENAERSGLPTPKFLSSILASIRDKADSGMTINATGNLGSSPMTISGANEVTVTTTKAVDDK